MRRLPRRNVLPARRCVLHTVPRRKVRSERDGTAQHHGGVPELLRGLLLVGQGVYRERRVHAVQPGPVRKGARCQIQFVLQTVQRRHVCARPKLDILSYLRGRRFDAYYDRADDLSAVSRG